PGVYNAATPLASAHTDSIPVLLISGQVPLAGGGLRTGYYHENDQLTAAASLTKARFRVEKPEAIVPTLDRAWVTLTEGRPGPVLLEVPVDVLRTEIAPSEIPLPTTSTPKTPGRAEIDAAVRLLTTWKRPLILAGGGVVSADATAELARVAERL